MGAECEKHGTDLVGHQFSPGGLVCPVCERDSYAEHLREERDQALAERDQAKRELEGEIENCEHYRAQYAAAAQHDRAERDNWKACAEELAEALSALHDAIERRAHIDHVADAMPPARAALVRYEALRDG